MSVSDSESELTLRVAVVFVCVMCQHFTTGRGSHLDSAICHDTRLSLTEQANLAI